MKNEIAKAKFEGVHCGFRCFNFEGTCDGEPFKLNSLPENIPGDGMPSPEAVFFLVRERRQRAAMLAEAPSIPAMTPEQLAAFDSEIDGEQYDG